MKIIPGDLVYYISRNGDGIIGMYIGTSGANAFAHHTIQWSDSDATSNETHSELMTYRYNYLDLRKNMG